MSARCPDVASVNGWVGDATMAPSVHNAQPWRFRYTPAMGVLHLRMDESRSMPYTDPSGRGLHLSCGAALFNLRVAVAHAGWSARVQVLPDPADPVLLATVAFVESTGTDPVSGLHPAIARRRTSREPFTDEPVPDALRDALSGAARAEGARLSFPTGWQADEVLELVRDAELEDSLSPGMREEIARWTGPGAGPSEGIPTYALGPFRHDGRAPVRDFTAGRRDLGRRPGVFEQSPCLAVLGTSADRREDWLLAGQALERVLLQATTDRLSTSLNSQALERPELRWLLRDPHAPSGSAFPQMLIRLGYGVRTPPTPRRAVSDVLEVEDGSPG
ncbi:Acg family FMN-binding oxidoreductase [Kitasatospora cinereorecta]|uniref:Acg family FMN-binding oxidoreductase n=1 Tax=Streptomyces sp. NPDC057429 TaxID=3346130 RepID=UPI00336CBE55